MKNKWKQLSKLKRKMIIYIGLLNVIVFFIQVLSGFWLSWWLAGIGCGFYFMFLLDCFGFFGWSNPHCPMIECHNTSCDHYLSQYDVCRYSQYPIEDSVLRSWILRYIDVYGVDKLYELISGSASDQEEMPGNE